MKEQNFKIPFESIREAFYVYCDMIEKHGKGIKGTPIASFYIGCVILSSIACEVGLKALLTYEGQPSRGHDLYELFYRLSPQIQTIIIQYTSYELEHFNKALLESKTTLSNGDIIMRVQIYLQIMILSSDFFVQLKPI